VAVAVGEIVTGKVVKLQDFGAFVQVDDDTTGLVHISEVAREFVQNIHAFLIEGQEVQVKVVGIKDDGRVDLSIKQAEPDWSDDPAPRPTARVDKDFNQNLRKFMHKSDVIQGEARKRNRKR
jgi:S1 RNA binding domain protein